MDYNKMKEDTLKYFTNRKIKVGDLFHEMFSYWIYIVKLEGPPEGQVITMIEGHPRQKNLALSKKTFDEFEYYCKDKYSENEYWVLFYKNDLSYYDDFVKTYFEQLSINNEKLGIDKISNNRDVSIEKILLNL